MRLQPDQHGFFRKERGLALAAVAAAVLTWGWSNVAIKAVSTNGLVTSFYRLWLAIPLLWGAVVVSPGLRGSFDGRWLRGSVVGGLLFALHQVLFFSSLKATSVVNVTIIGALQPALVLLVAGPLFGEAAGSRAIAWSTVAVAGTALVVLGSHGAPGWGPRGDALAFLNLFVFTTYFLVSKRVRGGVGATAYVVGMTTVSGLVLLAVCLATGQDLGSPRAADWPTLFGLAILSGTGGHILVNWAHAHTSAFVVSIMLLGVPVLATAGAAVFLGERPNPLQLFGGALVLWSIATIVLSSPEAETAEELAESLAGTDAP